MVIEKNLISNIVKSHNTGDYITIQSYTEAKKIPIFERVKKWTDFSCQSNLNKENTFQLIRNDINNCQSYVILKSGKIKKKASSSRIAISPVVNFKIPKDILQYPNNFELYNKLNLFKIKCPVIKIGEYPQTKVNENLNSVLEDLYNNGDLKEGIQSTNRWFSSAVGEMNSNYLIKRNPEFLYDGQKYVRLCEDSKNSGFSKSNNPIWYKVEPIEFYVKNWDYLPKCINKNGSGTQDYLKLEAKKILVAGLNNNEYSWEESIAKRFLNEAFLWEAFDLSNSKAKEFTLPRGDVMVPQNAFCGCIFLEKIIFPRSVNKFEKDCLKGCKFNYIYKDILTNDLILSKKLPEDGNFKDLFNISLMMSNFEGSDYDDYLTLAQNFEDINTLSNYQKLAKKIGKAGLKMPYKFVESIAKYMQIKDFAEDDFRFLKNEIPYLDNELREMTTSSKIAFFDFARLIGCFSHKKILDKYGRETDIYVAQKASSALAKFFKNGVLNIKSFDCILDSNHQLVSNKMKPNQSLLYFLSNVGENGKYENLEMILDMDDAEPGMFATCLRKFELAKASRRYVDENGKIKYMSWRQAFENVKNMKEYCNVREEDAELAILFAKNNISEDAYNEAKAFFGRAKEDKVPSHILGKPLTEYNEIEEVMKGTEEYLKKSKEILKELYDNKFYFEMLDKKSPINAIIGYYCDCCANLSGVFYGASISKATIISPEVQNMIVRDIAGNIVAKAAMYLDKKHSYIVLNEFDVAKEYKTKYNSHTQIIGIEKDQESIFNCFMRGIKAFVTEYDKKHPNNPIKQVNVGMDNNKLKHLCSKFEESKKLLNVPSSYEFNDAYEEQRVLYKRGRRNTLKTKEETK